MDKALHRSIEKRLNVQVIRSQRIPIGSINQVYSLVIKGSSDLILRRAPSRNELDLFPSWLTPFGLRREQSAIDLLGKLGPLLPETKFFHESDDPGIGDWVVQAFVHGHVASSLISQLNTRKTEDVFRQFGELTRSIHDVRGSFFGPPSHGTSFSTWSELVRHDCSGFQRDAEFVVGLADEVLALIDLVDEHGSELDAVEPVLIHSDLNPDHLYLDRRGRGLQVSGLIDLEFARFADPLSEGFLHAMLTTSNADESNAFLDGYGDLESSAVRLDIAARLGRCWQLTDQARLARREDS